MPPIGSDDPMLLILGSLPGDASLRAQRYYAHPQNQFWRLLGAAIGEPLAALDYDQRIARLWARRIALWDTVGEARRTGSLDGAIREPVTNALADFIAARPGLLAIGFNGQSAARFGRRTLGDVAGLELIDLPSSSPAYTLPIDSKLGRWMALRPFASAAEHATLPR
ncbi:DNA-deoxyinosine glycosylase [Sphingomonas xanthus]|uniref:DNA-deoxyinosine glycosylase n=1 Tax=Sphingomonas xanthus TaxID=2594473 RepID=A0A516ISL1_9SPHN|nr:DNA-deoxyinosine glycosylase [Sphingomonas xanthus]QDP19902.1 DNA-deoxyinosine glycosylase [Sphingomonas xanthus]